MSFGAIGIELSHIECQTLTTTPAQTEHPSGITLVRRPEPEARSAPNRHTSSARHGSTQRRRALAGRPRSWARLAAAPAYTARASCRGSGRAGRRRGGDGSEAVASRTGAVISFARAFGRYARPAKSAS